jgi:glyoxylase-like metal-dependent hydrolase (beta-lactamase superfamily II)
MLRFTAFALAVVLAAAASPWAQETTAIQRASAALGVDGTRTLLIQASGTQFTVGQAPSATEAWPPVELKGYLLAISYETASARLDIQRFMGPVMPRGGGAAFTGLQRQTQLVSGDYAWNQATLEAPAQPQPAAAVERMLAIWTTPHGFLKAATANKATTRNARGGTEVAFTVGGRYRITGFINAQNQVERVQTWIDNPVFGDMLVETTYTGYRDFGGLQFPAQIRQTQGGHPSYDLTVFAVQANTPLDLTVPENVRAAQMPPVTAEAEKLAEGVFHLRGGSHHSLAVDMGDHIVVVEGPLNESRSEAVIAETKRLIPNKPIRFVVNTHVHFDHSGGLRTFVDEGATVVTHASNPAFYEKAWAAPRTLNADRLAKSRKRPAFQPVTGRATLRGTNSRVIELHELTGNPHAAILIVWLPAERVLFQSDMFNPPAPNATPPPASPTLLNFAETLKKLSIQPERFAGGHGNRVATQADLDKVLGTGATATR